MVVSATPLIEMREYTLQPDGHKPYIALSEQTGELRCQMLPFLGAFTTDSGADINRIYHFYFYSSFDERDAVRAAGPSNKAWGEYVSKGRQHIRKQHSSVLHLPGSRPTAAVKEALAACSLRAQGQTTTQQPNTSSIGGTSSSSRPAAYLLCSYHVPRDALAQLLANKDSVLAASTQQSCDSEPQHIAGGQLVFIGCTAFGATAGTVVELWRFPSASAALEAQVSACVSNSSSRCCIVRLREQLLPGDIAAASWEGQQVVLLRPTKWSIWQ